MTARWMEEAAAVFGTRAPPSFPRNMALEIQLRLPITVVPMERPTPESMSQWMQQRGRPRRPEEFPRDVHGCMVWDVDKGILFHDSKKDSAEQRFTLAHEASHFVLEHLLPRRRAVHVLGETILAVLDGEREPTHEEVVTALFERVSLKPRSNLIRRSASGYYPNGEVATSERRADQLALELLAPAALVRPLLEGASETEAAERAQFRFGLPGKVARTYVASLRRHLRMPRFSSQSFLGLDGG
ncbi:ImmA/IrrE family metallo-endopeptidase [Pyxidicoccus sp. MSG2]|uniref:ImmA/IrrE family metallo-endopeptidase n=1 Tax=Pyxidicoccus sp. MSG2 TaxID=2996790 RepID=UPI00226E866D|nr:ImmA/IrrE family metallo-endopeptidase [Pyxidicoccus sp. MSG2]MCY1022122.1 ImmA/IrrE family metallo-endopeptidase [Pyxidicoccus sp. MSG2]